MEERVNFGKFRGCLVSEIPEPGYLHFLAEVAERASPALQRAARAELDRRKAEGQPEQDRAAAVEAAAKAFDGEAVETRQRDPYREVGMDQPAMRRPKVAAPTETLCESCGRPGTPGDPLVHRSCAEVPF